MTDGVLDGGKTENHFGYYTFMRTSSARNFSPNRNKTADSLDWSPKDHI